MKFNNKICFLIVMAVILILSIGLVSASEVDANAQVIKNNNDLSASNSNPMGNAVQSDICEPYADSGNTATYFSSDSNMQSVSENAEITDSVETANARKQDSSKLSSSDANNNLGDGESNDGQIDYYDINGVKLITSDTTIVSNGTYSVIFDWGEDGDYNDFAPEGHYENPWLMNDTAWVYCIEPGPAGPDGYYHGAPGSYKRITLTDEQLIHPVTGEDILPYLRTFIYYHFNDTENFTDVSSGKVTFPNVLWSFGDGVNYYNPNAFYNRQPYNNPAYKYVKETIDMVKAGNGIPNSGKFHDTDLTYQFYLYSAINDGYHFQNILGFNVFSQLNVTKEWDDNDDISGLRPQNISVDLYCDGEAIIRNVILDANNDWSHVFKELPVYSISRLTAPINAEDYEIKTFEEEYFDLKITKVWADDYSNRPNYITVRAYADGQYLGSIRLYKANDYSATFTEFNKYAEDGHEINYEFTNDLPGSIELEKTAEYKLKALNITLINEALKGSDKSIELFDGDIVLGGAILSEKNNWSYTFYGLKEFEIRERLDSRGVVHVANYTIKESEVPYYTSSYENKSTNVNILMPDETSFFDGKSDNVTSSVKITNKLETIDLTVSKLWDDKDNKYGKRPNNVTINLYADGELMDSAILNKDNGWKYEFKNLPKSNNGKLIKYDIDEINITYYHYEIKDNGNYSFTVKNILNKVHVFRWSWKLIGEKVSYYVHGNQTKTKSHVKTKKLPKMTKKIGKSKGIGKYPAKFTIPYNKKAPSNANKKVSYRDENPGKTSYGHYVSREKYTLFIYLYNQYLIGNMTYEDFMALLKENGILLNSTNDWDSSGTLEIDYDTIEDVPDSIELIDESDHYKDSSDSVGKDKPIGDDGIIDYDDVEVEEVYVEE